MASLVGASAAGESYGLSSLQPPLVERNSVRPNAGAQPIPREGSETGFESVTIVQVPIGQATSSRGHRHQCGCQQFICRTDRANVYVRDVDDSAE